jgi:hypothetical protein
MFFRKGDVKQQLSRPLHVTLPPKPPSIPSLKKGRTAALLDRLTRAEVYNFDVVQSQDASVLLELAHFSLPNSPGASSGGSGGGP